MSAIPAGKAIQRETLVAVLRAALENNELRFARQAALAWLAAFPGDLEVTLLQALAVLADPKAGESQLGRVIPAVEMVCRKDPFSIDGYRLLARASQSGDPLRYAFALTSLYALGSPEVRAPLEDWGDPLHRALEAYEDHLFTDARIYAREAERLNPDLPLAAALHLMIDRPSHEPVTTYQLALAYHDRWPECLPISLLLAEIYLEQGNEPEAVHLLHLCAASDATGQVARRLWGDRHPYRSLWPDDMTILFDLPIPSAVASRLGWNQLAPGEVVRFEKPIDEGTDILAEVDPAQEAEPVVVFVDEPLNEPSSELDSILWPETVEEETADDIPAEEEPEVETPEVETSEAETQQAVDEEPALSGDTPLEEQPVELQPARSSSQPHRRRRAGKTDPNATAHSVGGELEKLAKQIKQNGLTRMDGRFPVYVIFSSREGLSAQYGPQTTTVLQNEMRKLASTIRQRPGWGAIVYFADDAGCTGQYGLTPVNPHDPWKIKNALSDLDVALRQRGEMIGALLIVGGNEVVPFHKLPNPTDDLDGEVYSDSPYATLDANYFVPEWPVGRLPGDKSPDAALLLDQLRNMQRYHARRKKVKPMLGLDWLSLVGSLIENLLPTRSATSFGYTAAVWRRSSLAVFRPVGAPHTVRTSPPEHSGSVDREKITFSSLGYYNLHGLEDSPAWYGQRDPQDSSEGTDYPVALSPEDLKRNGHAPKVVFSEACYGAHVFGKVEKESLALKFLGMGTQAVVGSTCTAYGSLNTPLIAADLLGHLFWQHLKSGRTAGESLMLAKLDLAREMNRRQGFLDGEDQKTLISFVLYGDPLCSYDGFRASSKVYRMKNHPILKTVPDQPEDAVPTSQVGSDVLKQVKNIVAEYLPGAEMAEMHFSRQNVPEDGKSKPGAKGNSRRKGAPAGSDRMVVTVSKQVQLADHLHIHTLRVTLDEEGKPVKLSISR